MHNEGTIYEVRVNHYHVPVGAHLQSVENEALVKIIILFQYSSF